MNEAWPAYLNGLNAQLWANMQAQGITAAWEDLLGGRAVTFTESVNDVERQMGQHELYEFVVRQPGQQEPLASHTLYRAPFGNVVLMALIEASTKLEAQGIRVRPR